MLCSLCGFLVIIKQSAEHPMYSRHPANGGFLFLSPSANEAQNQRAQNGFKFCLDSRVLMCANASEVQMKQKV